MAVNVHLYPSPFKTESRMLRITQTLAQHRLFDTIYIIATHESGLPEREKLNDNRIVLRIRTRLNPDGFRWLRYFALLEWSIRIARALKHERVRVVNPHSVPTLPVAWWFKRFRGAAVVYDTHEIETEQYYSLTFTKIVSKLIERLFISVADELVATSDGHAAWYAREYGVRRTTVVKNYSVVRTPAELGRNTALRQELGLDSDSLLFLYLGLIAPGRGIELILDAFGTAAPNQHVLFVGFGPQVHLVRESAAVHRNVHYRPAVRPDQVKSIVTACDVGLCIIENRCLSYYYTLPNKMLECLNVGVPVIVSDFPDMSAEVAGHGCGWTVAPDSASLGRLLQRINPADIASRRHGALTWAQQNTWESQELKLLGIYERLGLNTSTAKRDDRRSGAALPGLR